MVARKLDYASPHHPQKRYDGLASGALIMAVITLCSVVAIRTTARYWLAPNGWTVIALLIGVAATAICWLLSLSFGFAAMRDGGTSRTTGFAAVAVAALAFVATCAFIFRII